MKMELILVMIMGLICVGNAQLSTNFYATKCSSDVEAIVRQAVSTKLSQTFTTIPATLRLFFHDCMVEGCDASVMIQSPNNDAEKDAQDNLSLAGDGFDTVVQAKKAVEAICPGVVSCADILTLATRDVVFLAGGPDYKVELGRKDGLVSQASRVTGLLPEPKAHLDELKTIFANNNLDLEDLVALSGAHTLGFSHCNRFSDRIYSTPVDPTLDPEYAQELMAACPRDVDPNIAINMDPETPRTFDNVYFKNLVAKKGLFTSDQVLFTDGESNPFVVKFANDNDAFNTAFVDAMTKLGRVGVKTGDEGEIRRDCTAFN